MLWTFHNKGTNLSLHLSVFREFVHLFAELHLLPDCHHISGKASETEPKIGSHFEGFWEIHCDSLQFLTEPEVSGDSKASVAGHGAQRTTVV